MSDQQEPSVLDFFLSKIQFWKKSSMDFSQYLGDERQVTTGDLPEVVSDVQIETIINQSIQSGVSQSIRSEVEIQVPDSVSGINDVEVTSQTTTTGQKRGEEKIQRQFPWKLLVGIVLALSGQVMFEATKENLFVSLFLYGTSAILTLWALLNRELPVFQNPEPGATVLSVRMREVPFLISIPMLLGALVAFGGQRFTALNLFLWLGGVALMVAGLWNLPEAGRLKIQVKQAWQTITRPVHPIHVTRWQILMILVALIVVFYRTYLLDVVPGEMFSDHAEKLLDVQDVIEGQFNTFFPRNTGREAFQMYLTATVVKLFGTGFSFLSLKIGTVLCGLLMLPYVYLLGKEIGNRWVGLFAVFFIGIAYWPNVISRVGLRYILYAAFAAPTLFYLVRGLRNSQRNDFVLSGIFLGIGLHGYSSFRFVPIVVVVGAGIYWLHHIRTRQIRRNAWIALLVIAIVSLAIFLPLLRYWISYPDMFSYRMATRLGTAEADYPGNPVLIFLDNFVKANLMFFDNNGSVWVHSIPDRPALDAVSAVFYFFGLILVVVRYIRHKSWTDLFLLVSIPLLLMPSILSIAFPLENPCLNRTSAAMVPVFLVVGVGVEGVMRAINDRLAKNNLSVFVVALVLGLMFVSANANYDLVFHQYQERFLKGAWNTSDMGEVIEGFSNSFGEPDHAFVIPYPYWVDTRLVGINAGYPRKDYALWVQDIPTTTAITGPKLFIFNTNDAEAMATLQATYPDGVLKRHLDSIEGKDFYIYLAYSQE
ncbi:MAG: glycosyltransferase family 39 protein [Anaerolineae bacterium]|nr:glycosyltransferase family 39 protein [Anaerolineae bacterium]